MAVSIYEITPASQYTTAFDPRYDPDFELTRLLLSHDLCPLRILYGYPQSEDCAGCGECVFSGTLRVPSVSKFLRNFQTLGLRGIFRAPDLPDMIVLPMEDE